MKIRIIKGTNQIGGCITEIECNKTKIIIDFGEDLDSAKESFELEGLTKGKSIYDAVFITHSHGDHIGLIDKINEDIPVYVEEKTIELHNLTGDFYGKQRIKRKINTFKLSKNLKEKNIIFNNDDIKVIPYGRLCPQPNLHYSINQYIITNTNFNCQKKGRQISPFLNNSY